MTNPIKLSVGSHASPEQGACVMELAAYLTNDQWNDLPKCTNAMLGRFAQAAWDCQPQDELARVARDFLPRLLRAKRTEHDAEINKKLRRFCVERAVASAKSVQHLARDQKRAAANIAVAEEWLATGKQPAVADDAAAAAVAAAVVAVADAAAAAAVAVADAAAAAAAAVAVADDAAAAAAVAVAVAVVAWSPRYWRELPAARLRLLDELLDYHEKLLVDAGEYLWNPTDWEDEALAFVDSLS